MRLVVKKMLKPACCIYSLLMLWLLFGQRIGLHTSGTYWEQIRMNVVVIPFRTISHYLHILSQSQNPALIRHAFVNLAGNVLMFIPMGFFLPCFLPKTRRFVHHLAFCCLMILAIELTQLFSLLGTCDIDDLLFNLIGTSLGYAAFLPVCAYLRPEP